MKLYLRACGIAQRYLPLDTSEHTHL